MLYIDKIAKAIAEWTARTGRPEDIAVIVSREVYDEIRQEAKGLYKMDPPVFLELYRAASQHRPGFLLDGVPVYPSQFGEGWTILEKKFF